MALKALISPRRAALALAVGGLLLGASALADDAPAADSSAAASATAGRPERGAHMASVEQRFGAPTTRYAAVGQPPITRWDYPTMVVYFEGDRVIHAVLVTPAG